MAALTLDAIGALAPDAASLKAAASQMKPAKWPLRAQSASQEAEALVWGECQGSGANPYRVVFDAADLGYKCTCPSRKFPCKHVLALMSLFAEDATTFAPAEPPEWVREWLGRRRRTGG
ncbi:MAG: SWIM zinc finger family protein, partial [Pseudomonadota bacterium]